MTPTERAALLSYFLNFVRELSDDDPAIFPHDIIPAMKVAADEITRCRAEKQRRIRAGAKGGRPKAKQPAPATIRSRKSRLKAQRKKGSE